MKKIFVLLLLYVVSQTDLLACEVCKRQQPKILRVVTHGGGPASEWDYVIVGGMSIVVLISFYYSIRWIISPGEKSSEHIKRSILNDIHV